MTDKVLDIQQKMTMTITPEDRDRIIERMSRAMGAFIMREGETDFATWPKEKWFDFVGAAFDNAAVDVFTKRIYVSPPYTDTEVPF